MRCLRRFISYYAHYKALFALDLVVALFSSALTAVFPTLTRILMKDAIPSKDFRAMSWIFAIMLVVYVFQSVNTFIRIKWGHFLGVRMENEMRQDLFDHLQTLSFSYFDKTKTGTIMSRITNDLFQIAEIAHHGPEDLIISVSTILISYILMFSISVPLSLVSLLPLPVMLFYGIFYGGRLKRSNREVRRRIANVNVDAENSIQGIREVKSFSQEKLQMKKFSISNSELKKSREKMYTQMAQYQTGIGLMRELYYFITVLGGAILIAKGVVPSYDLVSFVLFVSVVLPPIDRLINFTEQFQSGMASFERFAEVMDIKPEISDEPDAKALVVTKGHVVFENVSFHYQGDGNAPVIHGISLDIPGGKRIALVGESGAGKSTLLSLLNRFYECDSGKICIDGQDIRTITQSSLHKAIGFVQQDVFLFDASVRENLRYGKSDASDEECWNALEVASLASFVRSLPQGLDTEVGERGTRLSGGQKQRLSIARVFLQDPPILIFDEATSSLDSESENLIQSAFRHLASGRTSIVIAHRLSTIIDSDMIYVIDKGRVAEAGTHTELLSTHGLYAKLYLGKKVVQ